MVDWSSGHCNQNARLRDSVLPTTTTITADQSRLKGRRLLEERGKPRMVASCTNRCHCCACAVGIPILLCASRGEPFCELTLRTTGRHTNSQTRAHITQIGRTHSERYRQWRSVVWKRPRGNREICAYDFPFIFSPKSLDEQK